MGPKQNNLYSKPEYINSQRASFYCNIHHNMVHLTATSTPTCFTLLQDTPQHGSFYCNIATCFILLQYQSQHASFYWNMLHFTALSTTTCFILPVNIYLRLIFITPNYSVLCLLIFNPRSSIVLLHSATSFLMLSSSTAQHHVVCKHHTNSVVP